MNEADRIASKDNRPLWVRHMITESDVRALRSVGLDAETIEGLAAMRDHGAGGALIMICARFLKAAKLVIRPQVEKEPLPSEREK